MDDLIINRDIKVIIGDYKSYNISKVLNSQKEKINKEDYFASAYIDNKLVGSLRIKYVNNSFVFREVYVLEEKRNFGIGKKMMIEMLKFLKIMNKNPIVLYVDPNNIIAITLYKKLGFIRVNNDKYGENYGDKYEYIYNNENIKNILFKIYSHFVTNEEMIRQKKTITDRFIENNIKTERNIKLYTDENYFAKFDNRITDQKKFILKKNSLYLGKFPKEILINNILRKELPENIIKINNYYFNNQEQLLVMENIPLRLSDFFIQNINNLNKLNDICLHIFIIIAVLQDKFKFMHKDLTLTNILLKSTDKSTFKYNLKDINYSINTHGYIPILIDLSVSTIFKIYDDQFIIYDTETLNNKYSHNINHKNIITDIKKYNWYIRDINRYVPSYDIFFFINKLNELNNNLLSIEIIKKYIQMNKEYPNFSESFLDPYHFLIKYLKK